MLDSLCREPSRCPFAPSSAKKRLRQDIAFQRGNLPLPFCADDLGELGKYHSLHSRNGANIPEFRYGSGDLERMEHAKLSNGSGHKVPIGHSSSPALQDQMDAARSADKKTDRK